jgi:hypothetical protein
MTLVGRRQQHIEVHVQDERGVDQTKHFPSSMMSHAGGLLTVRCFRAKAHVHFTIAHQ